MPSEPPKDSRAAPSGAGWPERLIRGAAELFELAQSRELALPAVHEALQEIARISGAALGVARTGVWRMREGQLQCTLVVQRGQALPTTELAGLRLDPASCPAYVARLRQPRVVAIDDVTNNPICRGLESYLTAHGIGARLDVPLSVGGELLGVICHEHAGGPRPWTRDESLFGNLVATVLLTQLEAERRLRAELRADGSQARYVHLVENLPVVVYAFDFRSGALDYLSPNISELGGLTLAEWNERGGVQGWLAAIEEEDRPPVLARFQHPDKEAFNPNLTYRIRLPDGSRRHVRDRCAVVRNPAGQPVALHGTIADVTAEQEAHLRNREHARRFRELLANAELAAVTLDQRGRVSAVNDAFLGITGRQREHVEGADWYEVVVAPDDRRRARAQFDADIARDQVTARTEVAITTAAGEFRPFVWSNTPLRDLDGHLEGMSGLGVDLTDRDRLLYRHHHGQRLESLGRLAAVIAHDFNNLLGVIQATADELSPTATDEPGSALSDHRVAVAHAQELVHSLLAFSRRDTPGGRPIVLDEELRAAQPLIARIVRQELRLELVTDAPEARVAVDRTQLQQALINLVTNAAQSMESRPGVITVHSRVARPSPKQGALHGIESSAEHVCLSVADQGVGVPAELRELIFEPFFTSKADRGTGLGLATTQSVARGAGGFVDLESTLGQGSVFSLWFPRVA